MKSLLALFAVCLFAADADAGLFRRRCCRSVSRAKVVTRDCCGNRTVVKAVVRSNCCQPQPCCKPACHPQHPPHNGSDQARAQVKASYMAKHRLSGHPHAGVGMIGAFEGTGWATGGGTPGTCTPGRGMRCTADATACANGRCVRVRAWR